MKIVKTSATNLNNLLLEYATLPEYLGFDKPISVTSKSNFLDYPINIACTRGIIGEVSLLLENGADINTKGEHGYTPLHNAVEQHHIEIVRFLLENNADKYIENEDGLTAMALAELLDFKNIYIEIKSS